MIYVRNKEERGHFDYGWLNTYHTFSFSQYYDPRFMGFRSLRVINEDRVTPGEGFPTHPHRDMEIISYVLEGALEHKDSMGNGSVIRPGDVQRMSAGTGITHSEYNHSQDEKVHFMQIWLMPDERSIKPGYEQIVVSESEKRGDLRLIASPDGRSNSVKIHQDAQVYSSLLDNGQQIDYELRPDRYAWIQVARGSLTINGQELKAGDGAAIAEEKKVSLIGKEPAEFLIFDLA